MKSLKELKGDKLWQQIYPTAPPKCVSLLWWLQTITVHGVNSTDNLSFNYGDQSLKEDPRIKPRCHLSC